jgi:hypothetical protein
MRVPVNTAFITCGLFFVTVEATSQVVSTTSLTCSNTRRLQTAINNVPAGSVGTIVVSGTCNENVVVPNGKTVVIRAANSTAAITAANNALPAIRSHGDATIQGVKITNATGTAEALAMADRSGFINVIGSTLTAPNVETVVAIWGQSGGRIVNSRISGGAYSGVEAWDGSGVVIVGTPTESIGPDGYKTTISSPNATAVACGVGSSLAIRANASGANGGSVLLTNSRGGIGANGCSARVVNNTSSASNLSITGITGSAMFISASQFTVNNVDISGNADGINALQSTVQLDRTIFANNTAGDLTSQTGSNIDTIDWSGSQNSFPNIGTGQNLRCWNGGEIYLNQSSVLQDLSLLVDKPACAFTQ